MAWLRSLLDALCGYLATLRYELGAHVAVVVPILLCSYSFQTNNTNRLPPPAPALISSVSETTANMTIERIHASYDSNPDPSSMTHCTTPFSPSSPIPQCPLVLDADSID
ncbi:hypothetical protein B0H12DRAFT_1235801 [Mycena haematopus]|nr:hypothetical protein B0H12DRAFT_1235801 [Mycena haematopus]